MSNLLNVMKHKTLLECIDISANDESNSTLTKDMIDIVLRNPCLEQIVVSRLDLQQNELENIDKHLSIIRKLEHFSITAQRGVRHYSKLRTRFGIS